MTDTKKIIEAAERHLEGTDLFVVECTSTPGNDIELTIDSDTSVGIDACAELSRAIGLFVIIRAEKGGNRKRKRDTVHDAVGSIGAGGAILALLRQCFFVAQNA